LDNLNNEKRASQAIPRMDVASLIAAKRKSLKKNTEKVTSSSSNIDEISDRADNEEEMEEVGGEEEGKGQSDSSDNNETSNDEDSSDEEDDQVDDVNRKMEEDVLKTRMDKEEEEEENDEHHADCGDNSSSSDEGESDAEEREKAAKFFDTQSPSSSSEVEVFAQLTLSRPLLRGIAAMGYVKPTLIQSSVVPVALAGRDICASAVTGSGKTAAFLLPILEKLLYRSPGRIKALILTPTRELAAQIIGMMSTISQFTKLESSLIVGGSKNINSQQAELRARPQLLVATPGRLLDHVANSAGVSLEDIEFLVLDEADRLLDLGFQDEVQELIKACPTERQTLLFSATLNTKVDDLINLSLKRPVRIKISNKDGQGNKDLEVAPRLEQEFVRVRSGNEGINREGMLLALLTRTFSARTIVFFDTKAKAHRMMILCGLCGIKCAELHGNLTQAQRLEALEKFRKGDVEVLLATDLASRGLDISRVETVVNFEMPNQVETYIHRIGRTARAGRGGRSCTMIGEGRRHLMKEIMKDAADKRTRFITKDQKQKNSRYHTATVRSRSIPAAVIAHFVQKIYSLEEHVEEVLQAEAVARMDRLVDMEAARAQNIIEHADEIKSRPQRQWFASEKDKRLTKEAASEKARLIREKVGTGTHRMTRKKRRAREAREFFEHVDGGGDDDYEESAPNTPSMKKIAREHKRKLAEKEREYVNKSVHDIDLEGAAKKKRKGAKASDALGDSSLFSDEKIAYAPKQKEGEQEVIKSTYNFRGYDPAKDGRKKPKKKAHHKFKSKSKYKRR
jgi:ATP-dependent RNA helicase DDX27